MTRDGNGAAGPQAVGEDRRVVLEPPRRVVAEQAHAALPYDDQIEPAIVVEVEERGVQTGDTRQRVAQRARTGVELEGAVAAIAVQRGAGPLEGRQE